MAFARVALEPGERREVRFAVDASAVAYYDEQMRLVIEPGDVRVMVGPLAATVTLEGDERTIAPNDRRAATVEISS